MYAYAALLSVMHVIDEIQHHPRPPISLKETQLESLTEKLNFLQEFLEGYSYHVGYSNEADGLESRIADAAYAAEDVIESHIVDQILAKSTTHGEEINSVDFCQNLQKVIEDMDLIKKEVMEIKVKMEAQDHPHRDSSISAEDVIESNIVDQIMIGRSTSHEGEKISSVDLYEGPERNSTHAGSSSYSSPAMVGCDDVLLEIMDKLTGGQLDRQIIPIVGMGGTGKTTLARNIYAKPLIKEYFDICAWATISQEYNTRGILNEILSQVYKEGRGYQSEKSENELGEILYKYLSGRRYMIVMDDMWSIEVWDNIKTFFPSNDNGSRIVITTRLSNLASQLTSSNGLWMKFLDEASSWNLFSKIVFKEEGCPLELEETGRQIVRSCKGLPLSIVVIGGLLEKSKHTREYWKHIAENLNSTVNSEDNERCLQILQMSYKQLPVYLKPCFLYMGVFSEDSVIRVSTLIKLWVAEGFLKPISGKSKVEIAKEYLEELIDRNLILVHELGSTGNIKHCNIHDLLRDLCLREAQKERFYNVTSKYSLNLPHGINTQRRIVIPKSTLDLRKVLDPLLSMSPTRSLTCDAEGDPPLHNFRLLRILNSYDTPTILDHIFQLVNLQYLAIKIDHEFPFSLHLFWNLHTLIVQGCFDTPVEIWNMPQLRHVHFKRLYLSNPPSCNGLEDVVLENLETLMTIVDFTSDEEVVRRIPNVKILKIYYGAIDEGRTHCLRNLERLQKLESFACSTYSWGTNYIMQSLTFPHSLRKLTIRSPDVCWDDILEKIGSLPFLEKLQLMQGCFKRRKWETVEGQFRSLKFLLIQGYSDLESWTTESSHFPRLEYLVLAHLYELNEIPSEIGEIPTLISIELRGCSYSAVISAKKILEEQEELNGDQAAFQVKVIN